MQRLSEELEQQGEAVNHHADLLQQREAELEAAMDRATRAHDELIAMEPPSLAQAIGSLKILLRVSTGHEALTTSEATGVSGDDDGDDGIGDDGVGKDDRPQVWCLVRYARASLSRRRRAAESKEESRESNGEKAYAYVGAEGVDEDDHDGDHDNDSEDDREDERRENKEELHAGQEGNASAETAITSPSASGPTEDSTSSDQIAPMAREDGDQEHEAGKTAEGEGVEEEARPGLTSPASPVAEADPSEDHDGSAGNDDDGNGDDAAVVSVSPAGTTALVESGEELSGERSPAVAVADEGETGDRDDGDNDDDHDDGDDDGTVIVVEWRTQEEVDEWFAVQLTRATQSLHEVQQQQLGEEDGGGGVMAGITGGSSVEETTTSVGAPPDMPVLETPRTVQEAFATAIAKVKEELGAKLDEAHAELSRNAEAYKQYRARVSPHRSCILTSSLVSPSIWR